MPHAMTPRYSSLDFWRGVACLMVVVIHSTTYVANEELEQALVNGTAPLSYWILSFTARLWIGVPLFFVISGYCIAASVDAHHQKSRVVLEFFRRRFRRIFPPLWIFLALSLPTIGVIDIVWDGAFSTGDSPIYRPWWFSAWQWFGSLTLTETWRWHIVGDQRAPLIGHLWTLCYEEQFYFVSGLLIFLGRKWFFISNLAVTVAVVLLVLLSDSDYTGFFFDGRWLQFAAGTGVYYSVNYANQWQKTVVLGTLTCSIVAILDLEALTSFQKNSTQEYSVAFAFAILLILMHQYDNRISSTKWTRPISFCGLMCYSLYLIHWPVVKFVSHWLFAAGVTKPAGTIVLTIPFCIAASVAISLPFHYLVEKRFMSRQPISSR